MGVEDIGGARPVREVSELRTGAANVGLSGDRKAGGVDRLGSREDIVGEADDVEVRIGVDLSTASRKGEIVRREISIGLIAGVIDGHALCFIGAVIDFGPGDARETRAALVLRSSRRCCCRGR